MKDSRMPINPKFLKFHTLSLPFSFGHWVLGLLKGDKVKPKITFCAQRLDITQ